MVIDGIPPPSRNHRTPTGPDTPASAAAASLDSPRAIAAQNPSLTFTDRLDELKIDPLGRLERRRLRQRDGRSLGRDLQERARRRAPLPLLRARRARGPRLDRLLQR